MKKYLLSLCLVASLVLGLFAPINARAEDSAVEGGSFETAKVINLDEAYTVTWGDGISVMYVKVALPEDGMVTLKANRYQSSSFLKLRLYNYNGDVIWSTIDEYTTATTDIALGLTAGEYVMSFNFVNEYDCDGVSTNYTFAFEADPYCEKEVCSKKEDATLMKEGKKYQGTIGNGSSSQYREGDDWDVFKIELKKGHCYKFNASLNHKEDVNVNIYEESVDFFSYISMFAFQYSGNSEFIAPYSGVYYVTLQNIQNQSRYQISIVDITPLATSFSSLKGKSKGFVAKWKAVKGVSGYEIQYSTSSSFSGAKTLTFGSKAKSGTINGLTAKKKYYVRIRTYKKVGDKKVYSKWSKKKTVVVK